MKINYRQIVFFLILFVIDLASLLWPAIDNGFPLVYSDMGAYIFSGFEGKVPIDRPIAYGLFVRHMSLAHSLIFVVISQAILVIITFFAFVKVFIKQNPFFHTSLIIVFLSLTTGLSVYTSQIMPDIFSGLVIIGASVLIITKKNRILHALLYPVVLYLTITHFSNLLLVFGLTFCVILLSVFKRLPWRSSLIACMLSLLSLTGILMINKSYTGEYQLSRAGNVFIVARLIETGALQSFLEDECANDHAYALCEHKNELPEKAYQFIWDSSSPLYKGGCHDSGWANCWEVKNQEFGRICKTIYSRPKYLKQIIPVYFRDFFDQLTTINIGKLTPQRKHSAPFYAVEVHFENELEAYKNAEQHEHTLTFETITFIQLVIVLLSIGFLICTLIFRNKLKAKWNSRDTYLFLLMAIAIMGNALIVDIFSNVVDRYQARIIWIIPFIACIVFLKEFRARKNPDLVNLP